jgi:uncharacterized DUF497 family protein
MGPEFEWDPSKADDSLSTHGVSFGEAAGVFADPLALELPDPDHSEAEVRWVVIGHSYRQRLRPATRGEKKSYEER